MRPRSGGCLSREAGAASAGWAEDGCKSFEELCIR